MPHTGPVNCAQAAVRQEMELCNGRRCIDKQACATLRHLVLIRSSDVSWGQSFAVWTPPALICIVERWLRNARRARFVCRWRQRLWPEGRPGSEGGLRPLDSNQEVNHGTPPSPCIIQRAGRAPSAQDCCRSLLPAAIRLHRCNLLMLAVSYKVLRTY